MAGSTAQPNLGKFTVLQFATADLRLTPEAARELTLLVNLALNAARDAPFAIGSFTVATETGRFHPRHLRLVNTQRVTLEGTGALIVQG